MGYNKVKEEKKWLKWKQAEEQQLRKLGVDETTIKRLHEYDKAQFNKERQYRQRQVEWSAYIEWYSAQTVELSVKDVETLLNNIENDRIFYILSKEDKLTLDIVFYKILGYTSHEISGKIGLTENAIDKRISRLKKRL